MKRVSKHRGGRVRPRRANNRQVPSGVPKNFSPKEAKLKQKVLHSRREPFREAAYEELCDEEQCRQLTGQFARNSAERTGDSIGDIRDRYEAIVIEFLAARYASSDGKHYSLSTAVRSAYETDDALKGLLGELTKFVKGYAYERISGEPPHTWKLNGSVDVPAVERLRDHDVSERLMTALGTEYVRDCKGLMHFLSAMFEHWRKIFKPHSQFRVRLVTQQFESGVSHHRIAQHLARVGAVSKDGAIPRTKDNARLRAKIKKYRSRDQKEAFSRKQKSGPNAR